MDIKDLGQNTYLVGRRVIKVDVPGMFDLSAQTDRDELIHLADGLFKTKFDRPGHGDLTVCVLYPVRTEHAVPFKNVKYMMGQMHFGNLHNEARSFLREVFPEYADRI